MEKRTRHESKRYTSYACMIKGSRTIGRRQGKLIPGEQVSIPEDVIQLDLSMLRKYEQYPFKFASYPMEIEDYFNNYFLPV
jgi:hypothetical protein